MTTSIQSPAPLPSPASEAFYFASPAALLKQQYLGKDVSRVPCPSAVLDLAVIRRNCRHMLEAVNALGLGFRGHVKTHKTTEITALQMGDDLRQPFNIIVSTVAEAEQLCPLLEAQQAKGRAVNLLYGIPPSPTASARLKTIRQRLGPESVSFLLDHPDQLSVLLQDVDRPAEPVCVFIKIDVGMRRAGIVPQSRSLQVLLNKILEIQRSGSSNQAVKVLGVYTHTSTSYTANSPQEALDFLVKEVGVAASGAEDVKRSGVCPNRMTISVGATPQTASIKTLLEAGTLSDQVKERLRNLQHDFDLEVHAGVYAISDIQQVASHQVSNISTAGIALQIQAEVISVYTERDRPEVLIGGGTLALAREPCKMYSGWGIVAPSAAAPKDTQVYDEANKTGWIVGRISQEHGILSWEGSQEKMRNLRVGERIMIWPNHACITGSCYPWYYVIDSEHAEGKVTEVVDVWTRCHGW